MGNTCGCNIANKLNGINVTLLCLSLLIFVWHLFDSAALVEPEGFKWSEGGSPANQAARMTGTPVLNCMDAQSDMLCQGYAASGSFATLAIIVALFGSICSRNVERNVAVISAAIGLLNFSLAIMKMSVWNHYSCGSLPDMLKDNDHIGQMCNTNLVGGIICLAGFIFGIGYAINTCRKGDQKFNFFMVISIICYAASETWDAWNEYDVKQCADREDLQIDDFDITGFGSNVYETDQCSLTVLRAVFAMSSILFGLLAVITLCCKKTMQPKFQSFGIALAIGLLQGCWLSRFWTMYKDPAGAFANKGDTPDTCTDSDGNIVTEIPDNNYCLAMSLGGVVSSVGMPIALIAGVLFCMGCVNESNDEKEDDDDPQVQQSTHDPYKV